MLVLLLSPVPMVRGFGVLLVVGVVLALLCALTRRVRPRSPLGERAARAGAGAAARARAARARGSRAGLARRARAARREPAHAPASRVALVRRVRRPGRVLAWASCWRRSAGAWTRRQVETDITKLVPAEPQLAAGLNTLERTHRRGR